MGSDVCDCSDGFGGFDGVDGGRSDGPMVSMAWMDLMAPDLKSERESAVVWRALVASHSPYQALCFAFVQMPSRYSAINELASRCHTEGEG